MFDMMFWITLVALLTVPPMIGIIYIGRARRSSEPATTAPPVLVGPNLSIMAGQIKSARDLTVKRLDELVTERVSVMNTARVELERLSNEILSSNIAIEGYDAHLAVLLDTARAPVLDDLEKQLEALATTPEPHIPDDLGRFGHHPDPAIDFEIEVETLANEIENIEKNFTTGTPSLSEISTRYEKAMEFRVGGDVSAVNAKQILRQLEPRLKVLLHPASEPIPLEISVKIKDGTKTTEREPPAIIVK